MSRPQPPNNVSFQDNLPAPPSRRANELPPPRPPAKGGPSKSSLSSGSAFSPNEPTLGYQGDYIDAGNPQGFSAGGADVRRKKSMVRPERERIDPGHRLWHYREHAAEDGMAVMPSCELELARNWANQANDIATGNQPQGPGAPGLRRGKSLLARDSDQPEGGLSIFKRNTIRRRASAARQNPPNATQTNRVAAPSGGSDRACGCLGDFAPGPKDGWMVYCFLITCCIPGFVLSGLFGRKTPDAQRAWREKMGLVSIVAGLMALVGFFTFGFTQTVCGSQPLRIAGGQANNGTLIINGYAYDLANWKHPAAGNTFNGSTSPLYSDRYMAGGKDASFLFQKVNQKCLGVIRPAPGSAITNRDGNMAWYFPCNLHLQNSSLPTNFTGVESSFNCHTTERGRQALAAIAPAAEIYYTWDRISQGNRNLGVYKS